MSYGPVAAIALPAAVLIAVASRQASDGAFVGGIALGVALLGTAALLAYDVAKARRRPADTLDHRQLHRYRTRANRAAEATAPREYR